MKLYSIVTTKNNEGLSKRDKEYVSGLYNKTKIEKNHTNEDGFRILKSEIGKRYFYITFLLRASYALLIGSFRRLFGVMGKL